MSDPNKPQDDWIEVGQRRAAQHNAPPHNAAPEPDRPPLEERVLATRKPTPPGKVSQRVGIAAFFIMLAIYIFADLRDVEVRLGQSFRIGYVLMLMPVFGVLWGIIALAKREPDDARRAAVGIVLSLAALGLGAATVAARTEKIQADSLVPADDRTRLAPQDLSTWREEKLRRDK